MNAPAAETPPFLAFRFRGETLHAHASGALHWPVQSLLVVSDLHIGKSGRIARRGGPMLPPYEGIETLIRLAADIEATGARTIVCLGDSFDDAEAAAELRGETAAHLAPLMAGREWIWIEGNHDPGPLGLGGTHLGSFREGPLTFRHIASPGAEGEVSGHFHPKARLGGRGRGITRPCFLVDGTRIVMPAYGTYTGGLHCDGPELDALMGPGAAAILLGRPPVAIPMPRPRATALPPPDPAGRRG